MTKHNLREHLSWLIGCGSLHPSQPAYTLSTTGLANALGPLADDQIASQAIERAIEQPHALQKNADISQATPLFARPLLPASVLNAQRKDAMARLQSGPSSNNKPRMLSEAIPSLHHTPNTSSARAPGTSLKDQYNAQWTSRATGKSQVRSP
jgi:hypothetical protein